VTRTSTAADLAELNPAYGPYSLADYPQVVDCSYPSVPAGASVHDTITGTVDPAALPGGKIVNQAPVFADTYDPDLSDNVASATGTITASADVTVTKVADKTHVTVGDSDTFTITVVNHGPSVAAGIAVTEKPTGMRLTGERASQGVFAAGVWTIGTLSVGQQVTMTVTAVITGTGAVNVAAISHSATPDPDPGNDNGGPRGCTRGEGCGTAALAVSAESTGTPPSTSGGGQDLSSTGSDTVGYLGLGLLLLLTGAGALALSRRRRNA
jgi:uncharacterized repeat protein (TIGR01451 family)/LPXTG-motif cell wall-anchored protein